MKKSKKCIKCKGENIIGIPGRLSKWIGNNSCANYLHIATTTYVEKETYVCCDCGYSEEWVNEADLETLKSYIGTKRDIIKKEE